MVSQWGENISLFADEIFFQRFYILHLRLKLFYRVQACRMDRNVNFISAVNWIVISFSQSQRFFSRPFLHQINSNCSFIRTTLYIHWTIASFNWKWEFPFPRTYNKYVCNMCINGGLGCHYISLLSPLVIIIGTIIWTILYLCDHQ